MTDLLRRELAPILPDVWRAIDDEARAVLRLRLGARRLVDFDGPHGWQLAAVNLGRIRLLEPRGSVHRGVRQTRPLVELRVPLRLRQMEMDAAARGAPDPDLGPLVDAAQAIAAAEDEAIVNGDDELDIEGVVPASPYDPLLFGDDATRFLHAIVEATRVLKAGGVNGPYGLALGQRAFDDLHRASEDGYPLRRRVVAAVEGPIVQSPAVDGAVMFSTRGGDFALTVGQDLSVGYADHDRDEVELYLTESFTFRVITPEASIALRHGEP